MNFKLWLEKIIEQPNPFNPLAKKPRKFIVNRIPEDKSEILKNLKNLRHYLGFLDPHNPNQEHLNDFRNLAKELGFTNLFKGVENVQTRDINKDLLYGWEMALNQELIS